AAAAGGGRTLPCGDRARSTTGRTARDRRAAGQDARPFVTLPSGLQERILDHVNAVGSSHGTPKRAAAVSAQRFALAASIEYASAERASSRISTASRFTD